MLGLSVRGEGKEGEKAKVRHTRHGEEHKLLQPGVEQVLQQLKVAVHDLGDGRGGAVPERLADVVDAGPEDDQRVVARGLAAEVLVELVDLIVDARAGVAVDNVLVRGRTRHGKVVGEGQRRVELGRHLPDPVEAAAGRRARQCRVADRVAGRGLVAAGPEVDRRVRVAAFVMVSLDVVGLGKGGSIYKTSMYLVPLVWAWTGVVLERKRVAASGRAELKDFIMMVFRQHYYNN